MESIDEKITDYDSTSWNSGYARASDIMRQERVWLGIKKAIRTII